MKKTAVWDWNGTLLDDVHVCIESVNIMLKERNLPVVSSLQEYQDHFTFPVIDYYRKLGFDLEKEDFSILSKQYMALYHARAVHCGLFEDAHSQIDRLRQQGIRSVILSASRQDHLQLQTDQCHCTGWFDDLIGISDIYAREKLSAARVWITHQDPDQSYVMIGDSLHDHEVAEDLGWDCILIPRGHQSRSVLSQAGCPVVENIQEAADLILKQNQ